MIHDFATAPRQDWRQPKPAEELKSKQYKKPQKGGVKRFVLPFIAISAFVVLGQMAISSDEPVLDQQPDEAAKKEYAQAVLLQEQIEKPETVVVEKTIEPVAQQKSLQVTKTVEKEASVEQFKDIEVDPDYGFYDSLKQGSWPVPINKGAYVNGELSERERPVYKLQAASFRNKSDAYRLVHKLKERNLKAVVARSVSSDGRYWYQVNIGPFVRTTYLNKAKDILVSMNMMPLKKRVN